MDTDVILIVRRKTSVVCIGVGSCLLPNVPASAEARARLQRCGRLTSPMTRLLRGICNIRARLAESVHRLKRESELESS